MPELLFELGCEELPATSVESAYSQLAQEVKSRLAREQVELGEVIAWGTPRRLILCIRDVAERQPDQVKSQRGPALKSAFDETGAPTRALLGFCQGQGVEPDQLVQEGDYVWAKLELKGRNTEAILAESLPDAVRSLNFDKSMRWGSARMRFARPIRWILAVFDGRPLSFEIEGVQAGSSSRGHRFDAPEAFEATTFDQLVAELRNRRVEPDPAVRRARIAEGAAAVCSGSPILERALVEENVFLTEWPSALEGEFKETFLELPSAVLITAMAKHEKFFPVQNGNATLTNRFISIRNGGDEELVREGNAWVLNARFNDAKFFFDEDLKHSLDRFLERTAEIVFQDSLGNVRQRADRLAEVAASIARESGATEAEISLARSSGLYAKADLSSGLVSELPSLQGIIGAEYARREGHAEPICHAIATHYDLSKNLDSSSLSSKTALCLVLADQLDKLAGFLGLGMEPSGSSDPYGLRRAATLMIEAALILSPAPLDRLFELALDEYENQGFALDRQKATESLFRSLQSRYESIFPEARYDILAAALKPNGAVFRPRRVKLSLTILQRLAEDRSLVQTATRPINIIASAWEKGLMPAIEVSLPDIDRAALDSGEGVELLEALELTGPPLAEASSTEDSEKICGLIRSLQRPINAFFESTMVMVDDPVVRSARLSLLAICSHQLEVAGDFSELVLEGV